MRVVVITTYPPRQCGIGTFSRDLRGALVDADASVDVRVVPLVREESHVGQGDVLTAIRQDVHSDYAAAAHVLNSGDVDVVLVEHEYGIFGGESGDFLLSFVHHLSKPFVVTLHTVLSQPSVKQAEVMRALCRRATLVTVFTETARRIVLDARLVLPERLRVVPHGAPTILRGSDAGTHGPAGGPGSSGIPELAERLESRLVLSTFGLISPGKGIEVALRALPTIVARHPDVLYLVAGRTHPEVVKSDGERYRVSLERLVRDLGLSRHVLFVDEFLAIEDLAVLLSSTAVYLTPYRSPEQTVSGALTFAVVAGCPVVSTRYSYAEELLASGAGELVDVDDPVALAQGVLALLDNPERLRAATAEADRIGSALTWPAVGEQTRRVLREAVELGPVTSDAHASPVPVSGARPNTEHLSSLVDDVGIVQHADGVVPLRASGYCVDDAARLVLVALRLGHGRSHPTYCRMVTVGLAFLRHAWEPEARGMHNILSYDRRWEDRPHTGDHVGRTAWALAEVIAARPPRATAAPSLRMLEQMGSLLETNTHLREMAFTVLALTRPEPRQLSNSLLKLLRFQADRLAAAYAETRTEDWRWFEERLTYDNARLPQALVAAGHRLGDAPMVRAGLEALDWYSDQCRLDSPVVRLVGNRWRHRDHVAAPQWEGDEQPLDAAALVDAQVEAWRATGDGRHRELAVGAFEWFCGRNRLGVPVHDPATGGCHDGLGPGGLNDNQGAESTLAFLQAVLTLADAGLRRTIAPA